MHKECRHISFRVFWAVVCLGFWFGFSPPMAVVYGKSAESNGSGKLERIATQLVERSSHLLSSELKDVDIVRYIVEKTDSNRSIDASNSVRVQVSQNLAELTSRCPDISSQLQAGALIEAIRLALSSDSVTLDALRIAEEMVSSVSAIQEAAQGVDLVVFWCTGIAAIYVSMVDDQLLELPEVMSYAEDNEVKDLPTYLWRLGIVDAGFINRSLQLGINPQDDFVHIESASDWINYPVFKSLQSTSVIAPLWSLKDGSGHHGQGATLDVGCDNGEFYVDPLTMWDLKKEGKSILAVDWSFDGEKPQRSEWSRSGIFLAPPADFHSEKFIRDLERSDYLVLKIYGNKNDFDLRKVMNDEKGSFTIVPWLFRGNREGLRQVIKYCDTF